MARSHNPRKAVQLSFPLQRRLNQYALGAAAAGVAALTATPAVTAEVIFTPARDEIHLNSQLSLDLDHNGKVDFHLQNFASTSGWDSLLIVPQPLGEANGEVLAPQSRNGFLGRGRSSSRRRSWVAKKHSWTMLLERWHTLALRALTVGRGGTPDRYLGLKFKIDGEIHYGWARLTVTADRHGKRVAAKLTGYAYETLADRPIVTGQTDGTYDGDPAELSVRSSSSVQLGLLALGFPSR